MHWETFPFITMKTGTIDVIWPAHFLGCDETFQKALMLLYQYDNADDLIITIICITKPDAVVDLLLY